MVLDGHSPDFADEFDAIISNAALHRMSKDSDSGIRGIYNALETRERFVAEMEGRGNIDFEVNALKINIHKYRIEWRA